MRAGVKVTAEGLTRAFGNTVAVDGVDLDLASPEIVGLAGPNGSGKTTLIRCLLGLLAPTGGTCSVDDVPAVDLGPDERRRVGFMPQREAVYGDLTVRQNVDFFARLYGLADRAAAVDRALGVADLRDRAGDRVTTLSGGMVRRVSLACAVVHAPTLLVLDEPTVGLDPQLRATMWERFRAWRDDGALVLVSTHYLGEADHCDRVLFLRGGRVLAIDAPEAFLAETGTADLEAAFLALLDGD